MWQNSLPCSREWEEPEVKLTLTFDHHHLLSSSWTPSGHLCQIWRHSLKAFLMCPEKGANVRSQWPSPFTTKIKSVHYRYEIDDCAKFEKKSITTVLRYCVYKNRMNVKSVTVIKWILLPKLKEFVKGVLRITCSQEWDGIQINLSESECTLVPNLKKFPNFFSWYCVQENKTDGQAEWQPKNLLPPALAVTSTEA